MEAMLTIAPGRFAAAGAARRLADQEGAAQVDGHHLVPIVQALFQEGFCRGDAGIVHQQVAGAELGLHRIQRGFHRGRVGDVEPHRHRALAQRGDGIGHRLRPPRGQRDPRTRAMQHARKMPAEAAGGAGDQRHPAGREKSA